jgi:ATP-dependent Clp protease ATP-binding subunit ClpC
MFDRYTDRARRVIVLADQAAAAMLHDTVGTGHLLLGLLGEGEGTAFRALDALGVTAEAAAEAVRRHRPAGDTHPTAHRAFSSPLKHALELSLREALQLGCSYVSTEHLLLGLVREGTDAGVLSLVDCGGGDPEFISAVRAKVMELLGGYDRAGGAALPAVPATPAVDGRQAFAWELVGRVRKFLGHIEDMGDDERVFMLGALAGALEGQLQAAGVPEPPGEARV